MPGSKTFVPLVQRHCVRSHIRDFEKIGFSHVGCRLKHEWATISVAYWKGLKLNHFYQYPTPNKDVINASNPN